MYAEMRSLAGSVKAMVDLLHAESWQEVQEEYPVSPLRGVDFPADEGVWVDSTDGPVLVTPGGEEE